MFLVCIFPPLKEHFPHFFWTILRSLPSWCNRKTVARNSTPLLMLSSRWNFAIASLRLRKMAAERWCSRKTCFFTRKWTKCLIMFFCRGYCYSLFSLYSKYNEEHAYHHHEKSVILILYPKQIQVFPISNLVLKPLARPLWLSGISSPLQQVLIEVHKGAHMQDMRITSARRHAQMSDYCRGYFAGIKVTTGSLPTQLPAKKTFFCPLKQEDL